MTNSRWHTTNFELYEANLALYRANSSATVDGHEHEAHGPGVCHYHLRVPPVTRGRSLSSTRGSGCGAGTRGRGFASTQRSGFGAKAFARRSDGKGDRKSKTTWDPAFPPLAIGGLRLETIIRIAATVFVLLTSLPAYANAEGSDAKSVSLGFAQLVAAGDKARLAHRNDVAIKAYNDALDMRRDPAVEGRLGLILLENGNFAMAAENLLRAITKAQGPPNLMRQFHEAFARVRPKVCFVEVFVSEQDADVFIDGNQEDESDRTAFHVFVTAGSHTFQAKLKGFEDATETVDIPAGGELKVRLELRPLPPPPPPPPPVPAVVKPAHRLSDARMHFHVGAGAVFVLGAARSVAVGAQTSGGFRRGFFSLNVDARVAWATGMPERAPDMQLMTWAVAMRPCAHYSFLFGCGVVQVGGLSSLSDGQPSQRRMGGGLRGGVELVPRKPVHVQLWGEGIAHSKGYSVARNGKSSWNGLPILGGFGATALLTW